jgi:tetratricopeptide (TPR) repeat protein
MRAQANLSRHAADGVAGGATDRQPPVTPARRLDIFYGLPVSGEADMGFRTARFVFAGAISFAAVTGFAGQAVALEQWQTCMGGRGIDLDVQIGACTAEIQSGRLQGEGLAAGFVNRGNGYSNKGQYDRAIQDYDRAINIYPNHASAFFNRGNAYDRKGQGDRAFQDYDQAIRLNPNDTFAFVNRGAAYADKGQYDRAVQDFHQAIKLKPTSWGMWSRLCEFRASKGYHLEQAIKDCDEVLRLRPNEPFALQSRALVYLKLNELDNAFNGYDNVLKLYPQAYKSLYGRGLVKLKKGDSAGGEADIAAAKAINADVVKTFEDYGLK